MQTKKPSIDIDLTDVPDVIKILISDLAHEHGKERINAREEFVAMGSGILKYILPLVQSKNRVLRWEAAKIMQQIGDISCLSTFIDLLEDKDRDVRWIAAEALVQMGEISIIPLLDRLVEHGHSKYLEDEAHHVISKMYHGTDRFMFQSLLDVLKSKHKGDMVSYEALQVLRKIRK